ncbi:MAG: ATP-binding protein [Tenericutes bacterium]|nr:ATP-binding protein [Mycoplasmatota bacterium]
MNEYLNKELNLISGIKAQIWKIKNKNPEELDVTGINIFTGSQGSGKSLSMIHVFKKLIYDFPKAIVVTNLEFNFEIPNKIKKYEGFEDFKIENGIYGVIYLLDEIHLILNSLESKGVPLSIIVELSQQRKQRKLILGTSQVYSRMAKPLREQIRNIIICKNYFSLFQINYLVDAFESQEDNNGKLKFKKMKVSFFFHRKEDYLAYDTYKKMDTYVGISNNTSSYY